MPRGAGGRSEAYLPPLSLRAAAFNSFQFKVGTVFFAAGLSFRLIATVQTT